MSLSPMTKIKNNDTSENIKKYYKNQNSFFRIKLKIKYVGCFCVGATLAASSPSAHYP